MRQQLIQILLNMKNKVHAHYKIKLRNYPLKLVLITLLVKSLIQKEIIIYNMFLKNKEN